jgi:transcription initiation factor TFIID TATA-box-binding protein
VGASLGCDTFFEDLGATDYNPENFPRLAHRMHDPTVAALIL